jgi:hypothetical protein
MLKTVLLFSLILFCLTTKAQNGMYILNVHNQNFEAFSRYDSNVYINYYSIENKVIKPIYKRKNIALLKKLYLPILTSSFNLKNVTNNYCLEIVSLEDTCRINFIDVMPNKKDTMFDLAFVAGNFTYYRNVEKRIKKVYGKLIEKEDITNIKIAMLRGFHFNSIQYLTNYKIIEAAYAPLKPLYLKKECVQDLLVKKNTGFYYLCEKNVKEGATQINFTTTIKPKLLNGFTHYQFLYNNANTANNNSYSAIIMDTLYKSFQTKTLVINNLPFIGILDIAYSFTVTKNLSKFNKNNIEQRIIINQYKFINGKLETVNEIRYDNLFKIPIRPVLEKPSL